MTSISASGPISIQLPPSRSLVPLAQPTRVRVEEIAATAKVVRYDDAPARLRPRPQRDTPDRTGGSGSSGQGSGRQAPVRTPAAGHVPLQAGSVAFLTQLLGQASETAQAHAVLGHRDGPSLGSEAYRRAGGEPALYRSDPALFQIAV
jgi:hypothetical protein